MATPVQVPVEEYLRTSYEGPDAEYVEGEIVYRPMPQRDHADVQFRLCGRMYASQHAHKLHGFTEIRLRLSPTNIRVADIALFQERPEESIPSTPPLVVIEILSADDSMSAVREKLGEYAEWGVRHVWLIDPGHKELYDYGASGLKRVDSFDVPDLGIHLTPAEIF